MSIAIVGIGASAGGIESFCELITRLPAKTGCVDFILAPADIARELIGISQNLRLKGPTQEGSQES
jgi:hypothetical protein